MSLYVFLFLLVVCLLSLALLWCLGWLRLQPSHSREGPIHSRVHRLLLPRTPLDCPVCCLASTASSGGEPTPVDVATLARGEKPKTSSSLGSIPKASPAPISSAPITWVNSRLVKDRIAEEVNALKQQSGQNLMTFGSPRLIHSFLPLGLIDEFRLFLHPVVLGGGIPLFKDIKEMINLNLIESKTFDNGVVYLRYQLA